MCERTWPYVQTDVDERGQVSRSLFDERDKFHAVLDPQ